MLNINRNKKKSIFFSFIKLKKNYIKKLISSIIILNFLKKKFFQILHFFLSNNNFLKYQKNFLVSYVIYFCFSASNTVLSISDAIGNLKVSYSAGLVDLQGKQKVVRKLALTRFFNILFIAKSKFFKKKPVALHLKNVNNSNKFLIITKLNQKFFIKVIKTFDLDSYNGCRKKKKRRKR